MKITKWKKPFKYALKVLVVSAGFLIVGVILIIGAASLGVASVGLGPAGLVGSVVLFLVGYVTIYLGLAMAIFRYLPEAIAEEVKQSS